MVSHNSTPAIIVAGNDDLLTEILRRLPVISLLRFKSVSKHWLSLITHPHFSILPNPNADLPSGLFLRTIYGHEQLHPDFVPLDPITSPFSWLNFAPDHLSSRITILSTCNGLICCGNISYRSRSNFYVYNPSNQKFAIIPRPVDITLRKSIISMNLAFDPSKSTIYKIICVVSISRPPFGRKVRIDVYSSETGTWKLSVESCNVSGIAIFSGGIYCNGAIHWLTWGLSTNYFDLDQERIQVMPMPPFPRELGYSLRKSHYFGESSGHLYLIETYELMRIQFDVFEMERDRSGWFVRYRVDLNSMVNTYPEMILDKRGYRGQLIYGCFPLYVLEGERSVDSYMLLYIPGKIVRYNFVDKTFKLLFDYDPPSKVDYFLSYHLWLGAFPFLASLTCV
ncbi:hypothetical protein LguiA_034614 [Lonicera macranthoides]